MHTHIKSITGLVFDASLETGVWFDSNAVYQSDSAEEDDLDEDTLMEREPEYHDDDNEPDDTSSDGA